MIATRQQESYSLFDHPAISEIYEQRSWTRKEIANTGSGYAIWLTLQSSKNFEQRLGIGDYVFMHFAASKLFTSGFGSSLN